MTDSVLYTIVFLVLAVIGLFFLNPIIALIPLFLIVAVLALALTGRAFKHAGAEVGAPETGAATPSTREASYEPVTTPSER